MVSILLPVSFVLSTFYAGTILKQIASGAAIGLQQLEVWILQKSTELGVDPAMLYLRYNEKTSEDEQLDDYRFDIHHIELAEDAFPDHPHLTGHFVLIGNERDLFEDGLRHLMSREVKEAEPIVQELMWSYEADFARLKRLSDERRKDFVFRWLAKRRGAHLPALSKT